MSDFAKAAWCGQSSLEHIGTKVTKAKQEKKSWHPRLWFLDVSPLMQLCRLRMSRIMIVALPHYLHIFAQ
jgi:hypothetical protein